MFRKKIIILLFLGTSLIMAQQNTWQLGIAVQIKASDGHVPYGRSIGWWEKPGWGVCAWRDDGINFQTWITEVDQGIVSDYFYPGDQDYNFNYYPNPKEGYDWGILITSMDSYFKKGRKEKLGFMNDDILHIRIFYDNPFTGRREIWYADTSFIDTPPSTGYVVKEYLRPVRKEDIPIYECFAEGYTGDNAPDSFYFDVLAAEPSSEFITQIEFGIPEETQAKLTVHDKDDNIVKEMFDVNYLPGQFNIEWTGFGDNGYRIDPGVYVCKFAAGDFNAEKRFVYVQ
ncbi:MAG: hypothetical protein ACLFSQ_08825 [Candidatus Zixiibacteriota bacterium]